MKLHAHVHWSLILALGLAVLPAAAQAGSKPKRRTPGAFNPAHETVELFAGIESGELSVKFIPRSERQARVFIENKAGKPLNVRLPDAFAAVPVLAQIDGLGGPGGGIGGPGAGQGNQGAGGGGAQAAGGSFGNGGQQNGFGNQNGGGNGIGNGGGNNNFFNVAAEKVGEVKVALLCLEHGKANPRPAIPYKIVPLAEFSEDAALAALLAGFGKEGGNRPSAQAAAWHLANEMSWETLKDKTIRRAYGARYPYFSQQELAKAKELVKAAKQSVEPPAASTASR